jgi:hypothetical protein
MGEHEKERQRSAEMGESLVEKTKQVKKLQVRFNFSV